MAEAIVKLCECGCGKPAPIAKGTDRGRGRVKGEPQRFAWGHNRPRYPLLSDAAWLLAAYVERGLTTRQIAAEVGCNPTTAWNTLRHHGIAARPSGAPPTHGHANTPTYLAWMSMKQRILNPSCVAFPGYGGRGLTIEPEWIESYEAFLRDVGERPASHLSLDRIDNDRGYVRGNVRWADAKEQANNRRPRKAVV